MTWTKFEEKAGEYFHPMDGNLGYLGVAGGALMNTVLITFVWHSDTESTDS